MTEQNKWEKLFKNKTLKYLWYLHGHYWKVTKHVYFWYWTEAYFNEINTENTVFYQKSDIDCMSCILYLHVQESSITHGVYQGANWN
jgi:hypothetical protein